jgi:hypothetical protein
MPENQDQIAGRIDTRDASNALFRQEIGGRSYSFTIESFPAEDREWLVGTVGRIIQEVHNRAYHLGATAVREKFLEALGLPARIG